mgnify:CR=1 FL=1
MTGCGHWFRGRARLRDARVLAGRAHSRAARSAVAHGWVCTPEGAGGEARLRAA